MFASPAETLAGLAAVGYFTDLKVATAVFLAASIHRPILLEGPAGAGKTELAQSVARAICCTSAAPAVLSGNRRRKGHGQYDQSMHPGELSCVSGGNRAQQLRALGVSREGTIFCLYSGRLGARD
jgi:hypothetical protein